jgi:hypothetical protein
MFLQVDVEGAHSTSAFASRVQRWVEEWDTAVKHVMDEERPHSEEAYAEYLSWFMCQTRIRVTYTPVEFPRHVPDVRDTYPTHRDQAHSLEVRIIVRESSFTSIHSSKNVRRNETFLCRGTYCTRLMRRHVRPSCGSTVAARSQGQR